MMSSQKAGYIALRRPIGKEVERGPTTTPSRQGAAPTEKHTISPNYIVSINMRI
jgi:hypothetical protein